MNAITALTNAYKNEAENFSREAASVLRMVGGEMTLSEVAGTMGIAPGILKTAISRKGSEYGIKTSRNADNRTVYSL